MELVEKISMKFLQKILVKQLQQFPIKLLKKISAVFPAELLEKSLGILGRSPDTFEILHQEVLHPKIRSFSMLDFTPSHSRQNPIQQVNAREHSLRPHTILVAVNAEPSLESLRR